MQYVDRAKLEEQGLLYWVSLPSVARINDHKEQLEAIEDRLSAMLDWCNRHKVAPTRANYRAAMQIDDNTMTRWEVGRKQVRATGNEVLVDTLVNEGIESIESSNSVGSGSNGGSDSNNNNNIYILHRRAVLKKWLTIGDTLATQLACSADKSNAGGMFVAKSVYQYNDRVAEQEQERGNWEDVITKAAKYLPKSG